MMSVNKPRQLLVKMDWFTINEDCHRHGNYLNSLLITARDRLIWKIFGVVERQVEALLKVPC